MKKTLRYNTPEKKRRKIKFWDIIVWNKDQEELYLNLLINNQNSGVGDIVSIYHAYIGIHSQYIILQDFNEQKIFSNCNNPLE